MIINVSKKCIVSKHPVAALGFVRRLFGLIGHSFQKYDFDCLILYRCDAIHCMFMTEAIDIAFLDRERRVIDLRHELRPWRFAYCRGADLVLEFPAGTLRRTGTEIGDFLNLDTNLNDEVIENLKNVVILNPETVVNRVNME